MAGTTGSGITGPVSPAGPSSFTYNYHRRCKCKNPYHGSPRHINCVEALYEMDIIGVDWSLFVDLHAVSARYSAQDSVSKGFFLSIVRALPMLFPRVFHDLIVVFHQVFLR